MAGLCKVTIIGRVVADPELKFTPSGLPHLTFRVACNRWSVGPDGERREETEWFRVSAWRKRAETYNELLRKGGSVYVDGRLRTSSWTGQDGEKRFGMDIESESIQLLDPKNRSDSGELARDEPGPSDADQIPF